MCESENFESLFDYTDGLREDEREITGDLIDESYIRDNFESFRKIGLLNDSVSDVEDLLNYLYGECSHLRVCMDRVYNAIDSGDIFRIIDTLLWMKGMYYHIYPRCVLLLDSIGNNDLRKLDNLLDGLMTNTIVMLGYLLNKGIITGEQYKEISVRIVNSYSSLHIMDTDLVVLTSVKLGIFDKVYKLYIEDKDEFGDAEILTNFRDVISTLQEDKEVGKVVA